MTTIPTAEECGDVLLALYSRNTIRADEMLLWQVLHTQFINDGGRAEDFNLGLEWLLENGYIENRIEDDVLPHRSVFLTMSMTGMGPATINRRTP